MNIPSQDKIITIAKTGNAEIKIKGSRFISVAGFCPDEPGRGKILQSEQKKYHDATHHCWGWRALDNPDRVFAFNDDGEPSGTAGMPILNSITGRNLSATMVVSTRYFGGTKLGTGGLTRAYTESSIAALENAALKEGFQASFPEIQLDYTYFGQLERACPDFCMFITDRQFSDKVGLKIALPLSREKDFFSYLVELTSDNVVIHSGARGHYFPGD